MAKRGVQYIKGNEPAFLRVLKEQAGYVEPDTIEAKRAKIDVSSDDESDQTKDDEKPQVVVLSSGDLTKDQADYHEKLAETKPREIGDEKVIFKKPSNTAEPGDNSNETGSRTKDQKKKRPKAVKNKSLLSFDEDE